MTELSPPTFEVGKRAYWVGRQSQIYGYVSILQSGIVMSTGPAVTQVWDDNAWDPRDHHAVTFANDKVWPDMDTPKRIAMDRAAKELACYKAQHEWQKLARGV